MALAPAPALVVLEATGGLESLVAITLARAGLPVAVVNPRQVCDFAKALGRLAKTDALDAGILADFAQRIHPEPRPLPDDLWTTDFKGQFPTRDGAWCYPLTIGDQHTRYLLACRGLPNIKGRGARPVFKRTTREFGLPRAMRTDNGVPFATCGIHSLSQLNVWWMHLGIQHQRIHPASPPSSAPSIASAPSTTRNDRTSISAGRRPAHATPPHRAPFPSACRRSSTRGISWSSG